MLKEYASANHVSDAVLEDFRFMKAAYARGEFCGKGYVERRADGSRRIVNEPAPTPRRPMARTSSDRARRLAMITRSLNRAARLAEIERDLARARPPVFSVPHAAVETYRRRPVTYRELGEMNEAAFRQQSAR
jgi:hypothetical protein